MLILILTQLTVERNAIKGDSQASRVTVLAAVLCIAVFAMSSFASSAAGTGAQVPFIQTVQPHHVPGNPSPQSGLASTGNSRGTLTSQTPWETLGPTQIPNGTGISGLYGSGKIPMVTYNPDNPKVMYMAGGVGPGNSGPYSAAGIFRSTDGGITWTEADHGLGDNYVSSIFVDPVNTSVVLAGTWFKGIYMSTDSGMNWTLVKSTTHVTSIIMSGNTMYAASGGGILSSPDNGSSWSLLESTASPVSILVHSGGNLYAGTDGGQVLLESGSSGKFSTVLDVKNHWVWSIAVNSTDPSNVYVVEFYNYQAPDLYVTNDSGASWQRVSLPDGGASQFVEYLNGSVPRLLVGDDGNLFVSGDSGVSFTELNLHVDVRYLGEIPGGRVIVGSDQGAFVSSGNLNSWTSLSGNTSTSLLYGLAVHGSTILTSVQDYSPIETFNSGSSWNQLWNPDPALGEGGMVYVNPGNTSMWYAYTIAGFQYSPDGGHEFFHSSGVPAGPVGPGGDLVSVDPADNTTVYVGTTNGVYVSHNSGVNFSPAGWGFSKVTLIVCSPASSSVIYVGENNGSLYYTTDSGQSWSPAGGLSSIGGYPAYLAVDPLNSSIVYAGFEGSAQTYRGTQNAGSVVESLNGGKSFENFNNQFTSYGTMYLYYLNGLAFEPGSQIIAIATVGGAYISEVGLNRWFPMDRNMTCQVDTGLAWWNGYLYVSTYGEGVIRSAYAITGPFYIVKFEATGPAPAYNTRWTVHLSNGQYETGSILSSQLSFLLVNGTYSYSASSADGIYRFSSGTFTVAGSGENLDINMSLIRYNVTFQESGLPAGTAWRATFNGIGRTVTSSSDTFQAPNGTWTYSISNTTSYYTKGYSGHVTVNGSSTSVAPRYLHYSYIIAHISPGNSLVRLDGKQVTPQNGLLNLSVVAGNYTLNVTETGYMSYEMNFSLSPGQYENLTIGLKSINSGSGTFLLSEQDIIIIVVSVAAAAGAVFAVARWRRK